MSVYSNTSSQSPGDQSYFVPGYGISRHIIFSHIHFYLGPYASVRPYSYQGREGYLVTAGRQLTKVSFFFLPAGKEADYLTRPCTVSNR